MNEMTEDRDDDDSSPLFDEPEIWNCPKCGKHVGYYEDEEADTRDYVCDDCKWCSCGRYTEHVFIAPTPEEIKRLWDSIDNDEPLDEGAGRGVAYHVTNRGPLPAGWKYEPGIIPDCPDCGGATGYLDGEVEREDPVTCFLCLNEECTVTAIRGSSEFVVVQRLKPGQRKII